MSSGYYSTNQLCKRYGDISKRTLLHWRQTENFPMPAFTKRVAFYDIDEVHAWENKQRKAS
jgi:hypothetical protein